MSMTVEEVLKAEIPEGKFWNALIIIKDDIEAFGNNKYPLTEFTEKEKSEAKESLCAAFEALLVIANGIGFIETYDNAASQEQETFEHGCASTMAEVRKVVEEIEMDEIIHRADSFAHLKWTPKDVITRFKIRLAELEAKG